MSRSKKAASEEKIAASFENSRLLFEPQVVQVSPAGLTPAPWNPRKRLVEQDKEQFASLCHAMQRGWFKPLLVSKESNIVIGGNQRLDAALALGWPTVPVLYLLNLTEADEKLIALQDNNEWGEYDMPLLADVLAFLDDGSVPMELTGFDMSFIEEVMTWAPGEKNSDADNEFDGAKEADAITDPISKVGDVWLLGEHRLMCGDSTNPDHVATLMGEEKATLMHADPPYGMGKENEGVQNDNLYGKKLDAFQMAWWRAFRPHIHDNAGAYIWGNPEDLWRLWFRGGLEESERLTFRNEIVWDKPGGFGVGTEAQRSYFPTERCLFFMLGEQGFGNVNKDDFWEGFEPIRAHLEEQVNLAGFTANDVRSITGVGMYGHWFTKCQWTMIPEKHYLALQKAADGKAFVRPYAEIRAEYDGGIKTGGHLSAKHEFYGTRAYFDNTHDKMTDVWPFPRVVGEERHGHATPKNVLIMERIVMSSSPPKAVVVEPFAGSGTTLIACENLRRRCYSMEIDPRYVDVVVKRWEQKTGRTAIRAGEPAIVGAEESSQEGEEV